MTPDIVQTLKLCANDPMWSDHAEVNKATLKRAIVEIFELRTLLVEGSQDMTTTERLRWKERIKMRRLA